MEQQGARGLPKAQLQPCSLSGLRCGCPCSMSAAQLGGALTEHNLEHSGLGRAEAEQAYR